MSGARGRPDIARNVLLVAKASTELYNRMQRQNDVATLRRVVMAMHGEWP